ncbi:hypothetical protein C8Q74DRAFT_1247385 [Fomes fomentarius]|nr:hypothetical protein C8Q74DRAFT_1247385 [Fomes fomentarius]
MSSAQSAMSCYEIAAAVFECLSPGPRLTDDDPRPNKRRRKIAQWTLASAARVCHAFSSPALDVLWRILDDIVHLLEIFPPSGRNRTRTDIKITIAEWTRFQEYASRVRDLQIGDQKRFHPSVWTILGRGRSCGALLPLLDRLETLDINEDTLAKAILLTPTLRHLALNFHQASSPEFSSMVLDEIQLTMETVESLRIKRSDYDSSSVAVLGPHLDLWSFVHLRTLEITHKIKITLPVVRKMAELPHLERLSLIFELIDPADLEESLAGGTQEPNPISIVSLRFLTLRSCLEDVKKLFLAARFVALHSLTIDAIGIDERSNDENHSDLLEIYTHLTSSLRILQMSFSNHYEEEDITFPLGDIFTVLSKLTGLYELVIAFKNMWAIENAWPSLSSLVVRVGWSYDDDEVREETPERLPTIPALLAFARAHPQLQYLTLPYVTIASCPDLYSLPLFDHGLRGLQIGKLVPPESSRLHLAVVLDRVFPNLDLEGVLEEKVAATILPDQQLESLMAALQIGRGGAHRMLNPPSG